MLAPSQTTPQRPTILVIEDEADLREGIRDALELNGYTVVAATDGQDALEQLESLQPPCIVLMDLVMPRMNGWELCEALRLRPGYRDVPIIVHSSSPLPAPGGATRVVTKPLTFTKLLGLVSEYCPSTRH